MIYRAQGSTAAPTTQMIKTVLEGALQVERYTEGPSIDAVLVIVLLRVIVVLEDVNTSTSNTASIYYSPCFTHLDFCCFLSTLFFVVCKDNRGLQLKIGADDWRC